VLIGGVSPPPVMTVDIDVQGLPIPRLHPSPLKDILQSRPVFTLSSTME
jgi:hypothetical protein